MPPIEHIPWHRSITFRAAALTACFVFATGLTVSLIDQQSSRRLLRAQIDARLQREADHLGERILDYVHAEQDRIRLYSTRRRLRHSVDLIARGVETEKWTAEARAILEDSLSGAGIVRGVWVSDREGRILVAVGTEGPSDLAAQLPVFQDGWTAPTFGTPFEDQAGGFRADLAAPLTNIDDEVVAVVMMRIDLSQLHRLLQDVTHLGSSAELLLGSKQDSSVRFLFPPRHDPSVRQLALQKHYPMTGALGGESGMSEGADYRGVEVLAAYRPVGDLRWGLVAKVDSVEAYDPIRQQRNAQILTLIAVLLVTVPASYFIVRPLTRRLRAFTSSVQALPTTPYKPTGGHSQVQSDEIGVLIRVHNRMIDELEERHHQLQVRTQRFRRTLDAAIDAVMQMDIEGRVIYWNPQAEQIFGWTGEEAVGQVLADLVIPEAFREAHTNGLERYRSTGEAPVLNRRLEFQGKRRNGEMFPLELSIIPIEGESTAEFTGFVRDISAIKEAEAEILRARDELERKVEERTRELAKVNKELEDFAYVVAHDLKAPLRGIASLVQWLQEDLGESVEGDNLEHLRLLRSRADRMHDLIEDILEFSRVGREHEEARRFRAEDAVREAVELCSIPVGITVEIGSDLPPLRGAFNRIRQVFQNLIDNAAKYHDKEDGWIRIDAGTAGGEPFFWVADNGPGIEPKYHQKIFDIFQRLHHQDDVSGTGIGLALVRKIVGMYGGTVRIESDPDGTKFSFTLPDAVEQESDEEPQADSAG